MSSEAAKIKNIFDHPFDVSVRSMVIFYLIRIMESKLLKLCREIEGRESAENSAAKKSDSES